MAKRESDAVVIGRVLAVYDLITGERVARIRVVSTIRGRLSVSEFDYRWEPKSTCAWQNVPVRLDEQAVFFIDLDNGFNVAWITRIIQVTNDRRR